MKELLCGGAAVFRLSLISGWSLVRGANMQSCGLFFHPGSMCARSEKK
jgi:hypothetical protein